MKLKIAYLIFVLLLFIVDVIFIFIFIKEGNASSSAIMGLWAGVISFYLLPKAIKFIEDENE